MVNAVRKYVADTGKDKQILTAGGNDIESWGPAGGTRAWLDGFKSSTSGALMLNYGSADGCQDTGGCANGWTQDDYWYVSWGNSSAVGTPEIYYDANAHQWGAISAYGRNIKNSGIRFYGVLDNNNRASQALTSDGAWNSFYYWIYHYGVQDNQGSPPCSMEVHVE